MKKALIYICCILLLFLEIFCIRGIAMLAEIFPLENTDAVYFTLTNNTSGAGNFAISIILKILRDTFVISLLAILVITGISKIPKTRNKLTFLPLIVVTNIVCTGLLAATLYINTPISKYYQKWNSPDINPEITDIYETDYINPDSVNIEFKEKRNLILIFLESIEYNFQDSSNGGGLNQNLVPEITDYIKQEQSFIPGGTKIAGTGWTMADVIAKTCGIPMMLSPHTTSYPTQNGIFFPGITCLTDVLHNNGYITIVSKGARLSFSRMYEFIKGHSVDQGFGLDEYKQYWQIDKSVLNEWGVSDSAHYELIKEHIGKVSTMGKPWAVWFITLNTHTPYGATDPGCHISQNVSKEELLQASIRCSSRQLDDFIKWAKTQEWFSNTTITVMGDHETMAPLHSIGFRNTRQSHFWLDFFINSATTAENYNRTFSSLDMFPTILEALGAKIPGRALGLGRSLFAQEPTLLEQYGLDSLNNALKKNSDKYKYFIYGQKNSPNK